MRSGEGSAGGVLAFGGRGEEGKGFGRGSVAAGGAWFAGGSVTVDSGGKIGASGGGDEAGSASESGSGSSSEAGGSITTSGLGGRGGAGRIGTGGRSENRASSSIPIINCASCNREARTETFFRVRRRSTSRVEFRCDAEEIVHRTS